MIFSPCTSSLNSYSRKNQTRFQKSAFLSTLHPHPVHHLKAEQNCPLLPQDSADFSHPHHALFNPPQPSFPLSNPSRLNPPLLTCTCLILPSLTLPYLTLPCLTLPSLTLPCLTLPYLDLPDGLRSLKGRNYILPSFSSPPNSVQTHSKCLKVKRAKIHPLKVNYFVH